MGDHDEIPRYSHGGSGGTPPDWRPNEDDVERATRGGGESGLVLRALSVVPFVLLAAVGLIAAISWIVIIVFGAGSSDPIWQWAKGQPLGYVAWQILLAILLGVIPVAVTMIASWSVLHGVREDTGPYFWPVAQFVWGLLAIGLVVVDRTRHAWLDDIGLSRTDWWFAFGVVAFAMVTAGLRIRARRKGR